MELKHHGIKGQKWGVRRFQNADGSYTEEGKKRYSSDRRVFISGSSKTTTENQPYYRPILNKEVSDFLDSVINKKVSVIVGDAPGIDRQVQDYLNENGYLKVTVYGPGKQVRYSANSKWKTKVIDAPEFAEGSKEWLAKKDIQMEKDATEGYAVVLENGGAGATRNNVKRLKEHGKKVKVFELRSDNSDSYIE